MGTLVTVLKIFVGMFLFLAVIALIEPIKDPTEDAINDLGCSALSDRFIKPVCWILRGDVVLFVGIFIVSLIVWIKNPGGLG